MNNKILHPFFAVFMLTILTVPIQAQGIFDYPDSVNSHRVFDHLVYGSAQEVGIDSVKLYEGIKAIALQAIDSGAFPGCHILLAKDGIIFYDETFGFQTYDSLLPVTTKDIYDLASVTKTTAATLALMKLYDEGSFDPNLTFGHYFPYFAHSNKQNLVMRDVLAHQAGLQAWIPYWSESQRKNGHYRWNTVSTDSSARFPYKLSDSGLYLHRKYIHNKIYKMIRKSAVSDDKDYLYSGLSFYLYPELVERLSGMPFNQFLQQKFYKPLGAKSIGFIPTDWYPIRHIVPTELDTFFRKELLHGVVHDEGASMMHGISGNAGLFSSAIDLARVYQMLLNGGVYKGKRYLKESTVKEFTRCQFCDTGNRRGLGFDKPLVEYDSLTSSVAREASPQSFGHSGYTGTFVWADPSVDLLYVFLSNRVYPTRYNSVIYKLNVRPRIHHLVYELMQEGTDEMPGKPQTE